MGLISKIWKKTGLSKIVSYAAKRAKKTLMSFGKFMNKIGIVGQIAMMFILPGVGNALMSGLSGAFGTIVGQTAAQAAVAGAAATTAVATAAAGGVAATAAQTALAATIASGGAAGAAAVAGSGLLGAAGSGIGATLMRGAGHVLQAASNFVKVGSSAFKTVTDGVSSFIGEFGKTALNKIPGINIQSAAADFSGAWGRIQDNVMSNATKTLTNWNKAIGYVSPSSTGFVGAPSSSALTSATSVNATSATKAAVIKPPTAIAAGTVSKTAASTAFGGIAPPVAGGSLLAVPPTPTYMQKLGTAIKGLPAKAGEAVLDAVADAPAKVVKYASELPARATDQALSTVIQKEFGSKPVGTKQFVTNISAIEQAPAMRSVEMDARQYEVINNFTTFSANNQWGNTAQIYHNSMNV